MPHITKLMLADAADSMPQSFDTHAVIEELQSCHPQEYTRDLYRFVRHDDPFISLHAEIGRRLLWVKSIHKVRKILGRNVRGRVSSNQEWR